MSEDGNSAAVNVASAENPSGTDASDTLSVEGYGQEEEEHYATDVGSADEDEEAQIQSERLARERAERRAAEMLAETQQLALDTQRLSLEEKRYKYKEALQKALSHLDVDSTDPDKEIKRAQVFANIKRQVRKLQEDTYLGMAIGEKPNLVVEWACAKLRKVDNTIDHSYADNNDLESFFLQIESRYAYAREDVAALEKLKKTRNIKTERDVSTACDEFKRLSKLQLQAGAQWYGTARDPVSLASEQLGA
jgi:hypothetical protein